MEEVIHVRLGINVTRKSLTRCSFIRRLSFELNLPVSVLPTHLTCFPEFPTASTGGRLRNSRPPIRAREGNCYFVAYAKLMEATL